jgi:tRNA1(Val) A37 N6-methylase TrmN6
MLAGLCMAPGLAEKKDIKILVLGTGAGLLPMFLKSQLKDRLNELVTVDINPEIVKVSESNH